MILGVLMNDSMLVGKLCADHDGEYVTKLCLKER